MIRTILWVVAAILAYHFIGRITHALTLIFASFFLALALNPVVSWMSRRLGIRGRVKATAAAYVSILAFLAIFLALIIPPLVRQTRDFIQEVPQLVSDFQSQDSGLSRIASKYHVDEKLTQGARDFASHYSNFGETAFATGKRVADVLVSILVVIFMTFMMLVEGPRWLELIWGAMPDKRRAHYRQIAHKMYRGVTGFVNGQVIMAVVAGIFAFLALTILSTYMNVTINALALAGIVAVFGLIPLFGNPISSAIVVLVCLVNSVSLALAMLAYFAIYYFIENHTFQPIIQSRLNNLTPLTVFMAAIVGVGFGGFLGAIVAIPAATCVKILLEDYFERRQSRKTKTMPHIPNSTTAPAKKLASESATK